MKIRLILISFVVVSSMYAGDGIYNNMRLDGWNTGPTAPTLKAMGRGGVVFDAEYPMGTGRLYNYMSGNTGFAFDPGLSSVQIGSYNTASTYFSGQRSLSVGSDNYLNGDDSIAVGNYSSASGHYSASFGYLTEASGVGSFAQGEYAIADGYGSVAMNAGAAAGDYSVAFNSSIVSGYLCLGQGLATVVGDYSAGFGMATAASAYSVAIGQNNVTTNYSGATVSGTTWNANDPVLSVGIGTGPSARKDALTVYKGGQVRISKRQGDILMGSFGKPGSGD